MNTSGRYLRRLSRCFVLLSLLLAQQVAASVDFALLRSRIYGDLTGYTYDVNDTDIKTKITSATQNAKAKQNAFISGDNGRATIWPDLTFVSSADITEAFDRLKLMATAYQLVGSELYHNEALLANIVSGLNWLNANKYNKNKPIYDNWWDFRIGASTRLNNVLILVGNEIPESLFTGLTDAVDYYCGSVGSYTGANLVWIVNVIGTRALLVEDENKLLYARNALLPALEYVTTGDGFYDDGSFIQHTAHPYSGAYGMSFMGTVVQVLCLFYGTDLALPESYSDNILSWVYDGFEPLIFKGALCAFVRGREISRNGSTDNKKGREFLQILLRLIRVLPETEYNRMAGLIKYLLTTDTTFSGYYDGINTIADIMTIKQIVSDTPILPRSGYNIYKQYPSMDRVMMQRDKFAFGVSMHSSRVYNFEMLNDENLKGWHTGSGMTYLYNADAAQYDLHFWPTVNPYRLPGTTVPGTKSYGKNSYSDAAWVGGASLLNKYGVSGMFFNSTKLKMQAKKSWFMFDNEIVCLGSGVASSDGTAINTYIDQRRLVTDNRNSLYVDNVLKPALFGTDESPETWNDVSWMYLSGKYSSNGQIGYYFPEPATLKAIRIQQTGKWSEINAGGDATERKNYFLTLWKEHGSPLTTDEDDNTRYAYVLLPELTKSVVQAYASNPDIEILANTTNQHAVRERRLGITAVNFWNNISSQILEINGLPYIACDKKASVIVQETADSVVIGVSDPTQLSTDPVTVRLYTATSGVVLSGSPEIELISSSDPVTLKVNVNGSRGKTHQIILRKNATALAVTPDADDFSSTLRVVDGRTLCSVQVPQSGKLSVTIASLAGSMMANKEIILIPGINNFEIFPSKELRGVYLITLEFNGNRKNYKMMY